MTTKEKILNLLKREVTLAVSDFTERLDITHMAVRKHLTVLENDGLIESEEVKQQMGRPLQMYSLADHAEKHFPKNYEAISIEFLRDIKELHGEESIERLFSKREERLTQEYNSRLENKNPSEKVKEIVNIQNEKGYMADLSQIDENTYELIEYNCPILTVAKEFKLACRCETEMLKNVLGTQQIKRTYCRTEGDNNCTFLVEF